MICIPSRVHSSPFLSSPPPPPTPPSTRSSKRLRKDTGRVTEHSSSSDLNGRGEILFPRGVMNVGNCRRKRFSRKVGVWKGITDRDGDPYLRCHSVYPVRGIPGGRTVLHSPRTSLPISPSTLDPNRCLDETRGHRGDYFVSSSEGPLGKGSP